MEMLASHDQPKLVLYKGQLRQNFGYDGYSESIPMWTNWEDAVADEEVANYAFRSHSCFRLLVRITKRRGQSAKGGLPLFPNYDNSL